MKRSLLRLAGVLAALACPSAASALDSFTFIPTASGEELAVYTEAVTGLRDLGTPGQHGTEDLARVAYSPGRDWAIDGTVGTVDNEVTRQSESSFAVEGRYSGIGHGLALGTGYRRDYERVAIPYLRMVWASSGTLYPTGISAIVEFPHGGNRDAAELTLAGAQGFPCGNVLSCAFEIAGEDLEGFVAGSTRLIVGPTFSLGWEERHRLKIFAGWVHAATLTGDQGGSDGAMFRIALRFGT